jgi:putative nucleotidyltransferase with HDIG domain
VDRLTRRGFLGTRIARRVLLSFIVCALLPVAALAVIAHRQVTHHLRTQSESRLRQETKTAGMAVVQRLQLLDAELVVLAHGLASSGAVQSMAPTARFARVRLVAPYDPGITELPRATRDRLLSGEPTLIGRAAGLAVVTLGHAIKGEAGVWVALGDVAPAFLSEASQPSGNGGITCILDEHGTALACPEDIAGRLLAVLPATDAGDARPIFDLDGPTGGHLAAAWPIFLGGSLGGPAWMAVATEELRAIYQPVRDFQRLLVLAFVLAVVIVLFLSHIQIRRSLEPVELLREGTHRIGARDFRARVHITSGDEFEQLGGAFNTMAENLGLQFRTLATRAELDRAVLSSLDEATIVATVLERGRDLVPCSVMSVVTIAGTTASARTSNGGTIGHATWTIGDHDVAPLGADASLVSFGSTHGIGRLAPPELAATPASWTLATMRNGGKLMGWLLFRHGQFADLDAEAGLRASGLADQVAVALSNARLVRDIDNLRWGALEALGRAVDAKSAWTAGHSERVTSYAVTLGNHLGLSGVDLERLRRGGLIHDVGKIGVRAEILDKPGKLTAEEWDQMRAHPAIGARILEPIAAFEDVIPIVLHHHEKYDGTGYPAGLAGVKIPYFARILAVADVFDALTSDRPYRAGMERAVALGIIRKDAGTHFDPGIAAVFLEKMEEDEWQASTAGELVALSGSA